MELSYGPGHYRWLLGICAISLGFGGRSFNCSEAGAVISAPDGGKFDLFKGDVLAVTPGIYQELVKAING